MNFPKKLSAIAASTALVFAGFSAGATPAMAALNSVPAQIPAQASIIDMANLGWNTNNDKAENWRGYRGARGYRGYGYGRYGRYGRGHYRHRNRVDAGDVLAGVLIIGGIAAIASAASKNSRSNDDRYDRPNDRRYDDRRYDERGYNDNRYNDRDTGSVDLAINACSDAAERQAGGDARVSGIQSVERDGNGWRVEGDLSGSDRRTFLCGATDGRVDFVQLDGRDLAFAN